MRRRPDLRTGPARRVSGPGRPARRAGQIRVVVADDQELVRDGIAAILDLEADLTVAATAADGAEAVGLVNALKPDVAIMDIRMPVVDGIEATSQLIAAGTTTRILILTTF